MIICNGEKMLAGKQLICPSRIPYIANGLVAMWDCTSASTSGEWKDEISGFGLDWNGSGVVNPDGGISMADHSSWCASALPLLASQIVQAKAATYEFVGNFKLSNFGSGWRGIAIGAFNSVSSCDFLINHTKDNYVNSYYNRMSEINTVNFEGKHCFSASYSSKSNSRIWRYDNMILSQAAYNEISIGDEFGFGLNGSQPKGGMKDNEIYCFRVYSRQLTDSEAAHNYAVDKMRFGL